MNAVAHTYTYIAFSCNYLRGPGTLGDVQNGEDAIRFFKAHRGSQAGALLQRIKNPDVRRKTLNEINELKCDFIFRRQVIKDNQSAEDAEEAFRIRDYSKAYDFIRTIKDPEKRDRQFNRTLEKIEKLPYLDMHKAAEVFLSKSFV